MHINPLFVVVLVVLSDNSIGDEGATALAGALVETKTLETVWLHGVSSGGIFCS